MSLKFGALSKILEVKAAGDAWEVAGYASTFGNIDAGGDVVLPGAFDSSLAAFHSGSGKVRFLSSHDLRLTLGVVKELKSDDIGLFGRFGISKTQLGQDTHTLLQDGALDSFSIGYMTRDAEFRDDGTRLLKDLELLEVSVVPIPMNDAAVVTDVKAFDPDVPFDVLLKQISTYLERGVTEAEALAQRRAEDERKLSDAHLAAIKSLLETTGVVSGRLEGLLAGPPKSAPALNLRLELARRRLRAKGILEHAS